MDGTLDRAWTEAPALTGLGALSLSPKPVAERARCFHCGEPCRDDTFCKAERIFCCQGCLVVHDLLAENGLDQFYDLSRHPGVRVARPSARREQWACLDEPGVQTRLLDFTDGNLSRITFHVPAIHCIACVWLLENLFRLHPGVGRSRVNFPRRELAIAFAPQKIKLCVWFALLASLGYEPRLTLGELEKPAADSSRKKQWLQLGIAGFAFGNIMLFSLPGYIGLDSWSGPLFRAVFGYISLALALPVLLYSASDYWRSALVSLRRKALTLDVPIALGLAALYGQSAFEILTGRGEGYLDSLAGLIFFLLIGRAFQQKTHDRLTFDRDYKNFFPLTVTRNTPAGEESVALSNLGVGDRLVLRHGELIPADSRLVSGSGLVDYSFVTGESDPLNRSMGDHLYAGGKQVGGAIEVETVKPVSQSYLTSLWAHETFRKRSNHDLDSLTNRYSRRFTWVVLAVALGAAVFWGLQGQGVRGLKAFTSVLIVACPCALALAAPFTLGTVQRILARWRGFLKNSLVVERMARVDVVVFDKTGTLTAARESRVSFVGGGEPLRESEEVLALSLARHSGHPNSARIAGYLGERHTLLAVSGFSETPGKGIEGMVDGHRVRLGSGQWLREAGIEAAGLPLPPGGVTYLALDGLCRGAFVFASELREDADRLLHRLGREYEIALLSGDNEKERERFRSLFGSDARLHFNQSPLEKLAFIQNLQRSGRVVMMVGDGLNDAGALKQSDVGVAVVEKAGAFSPASDVILDANEVSRLAEILELSRRAARVVRLGFGLSGAYNLVGVGIAAAGVLSPLVCAVLMPLSSISVVLFACGMTRRAARLAGLDLAEAGGETEF